MIDKTKHVENVPKQGSLYMLTTDTVDFDSKDCGYLN